jgi:hypothetical protein
LIFQQHQSSRAEYASIPRAVRYPNSWDSEIVLLSCLCAHAKFVFACAVYSLAKKKEVWQLQEKLIPTKVNVEGVDLKGRKIILKNMPAEFNKKRNITRVDLGEVIKRQRKLELARKRH